MHRDFRVNDQAELRSRTALNISCLRSQTWFACVISFKDIVFYEDLVLNAPPEHLNASWMWNLTLPLLTHMWRKLCNYWRCFQSNQTGLYVYIYIFFYFIIIFFSSRRHAKYVTFRDCHTTTVYCFKSFIFFVSFVIGSVLISERSFNWFTSSEHFMHSVFIGVVKINEEWQ